MISLHIDPWLIFLNCFVIYGVWHSFKYELYPHIASMTENTEIFGKIHHAIWYWWFIKKPSVRMTKNPWWLKPLLACPSCMATVWGTLFYWLFQPSPNIQSWVVHVVALAGLNRLLKSWL